MMRFPKPRTPRNPKRLALIREYGAIPGWLACVDCGASDGTIVPAHANQGKGKGIKADDNQTMALCYVCHCRLDQPSPPDCMPQKVRRLYEERMVRLTDHALKRIEQERV